MYRKGFCILVFCLFLLNSLRAQNQTGMIPFAVSDDFETGELFGWEPYPYNQDGGYDPLYFTRKSPTHNSSKYALARPVRANESAELAHGFTKRLNFWTTTDTRIRAAIFFHSDRNAEKLELSLGTFDGRRYFYTIQNPEANRWLELDIPAAEFIQNGQSLSAGEHIQVITVKGSYSIVYYLNTYTILMDDFKINGVRERQFVAKEPSSTFFVMFDTSVLNKHFFYGDNISLKIAPEGGLNLKTVTGALVDSRGKIVKENIRFDKNGNDWVNNSIYALSKKDARGQWQIRLTGSDEQDKDVKWSIRFLMPGDKVNSHPRLFFSKDELQHRIATEKSAVAKKILNNALKSKGFMNINLDAIKEYEDNTSEALSAGPYSPSASEATGWRTGMDALTRVIEAGSFRYAFTGEETAGQKAKQALLKLCAFSKWNNNWMLDRKFWTYYPAAETVARVAYGYDMLYALLTEEERKFVRTAMIEKGLKLFQRDMVEMNRMPSNNSNHIAVIVSGHALAAAAIYGDDPENPYIEPYLSGIITKAKAFIDRAYYEDGSYSEPKNGYMNMATMALTELLATFERNFGIDYSTTTNVQHFYKYILQATDNPSLDYGYTHASVHMQDFGDDWEYASLGRLLHTQWFVYRTGNPILYNFVKPYSEQGKGGYFGYLWYREDITPATRESLPVSKVFSADGMIMRSGWDSTATIINTHVGPNGNHYHYDQGSFQVMTNGEALLSDPGVGEGGYYNNLDYLVYNIQAVAHNTLLVDHDPESQEPAHFDNGITALRDWPKMTHTFAGNLADGIESDLHGVYKGKLEKYTRALLYVKNGPLFLFDQVKSKSDDGHVYDWLFHAPQNDGKRSITYAKLRIMIDRPKARLTIDVITPDISTGRIRDNNEDHESFISLSTPKSKETNFLAVIMPEAKPLSGDYSARPVSSKIDAEGWIGAKVEHAGMVNYGFFRIESAKPGTAGGFTTDAKRFTASLDASGKLMKAYFEGSSFEGNGLTVNAESPVNLAIEIGSKDTRLEIQSKGAGKVSISSKQKPASVFINGSLTKNWKFNSSTKSLELSVSDGMNTFVIK